MKQTQLEQRTVKQHFGKKSFPDLNKHNLNKTTLVIPAIQTEDNHAPNASLDMLEAMVL